MVIQSVPMYVKKKCVWVHAESWASPAEAVDTNGIVIAQAMANRCPRPSSMVSIYISNERIFFFVPRSVGAVRSSLFLDMLFFSGCAESIRFA